MKKIIIFVLCLITCASCFASCGSQDDFVPAGFKRASSKDADYVLYVPEAWVVDISTGVTTAYVSSSNQTNVSFISFDLSEDVKKEFEDKEKITVDDYWSYYEKTFKDTFSDMKYAENGNGDNIKLSNGKLDGKKYIYTATVTGIECDFMQVIAIKGETVYMLTYTAREDNFATYKDKVDEIIEHLEIK